VRISVHENEFLFSVKWCASWIGDHSFMISNCTACTLNAAVPGQERNRKMCISGVIDILHFPVIVLSMCVVEQIVVARVRSSLKPD